MATYTVKPAQNLFDVALHLYGSIEGLFDLLITNQWLNMTTDLTPGMELGYHEDFVINESIVNQYGTDNITPANGERHVYFKQSDYDLVFLVGVNNTTEMVRFIAAGEGDIQIDWGDNTDLQTITLGLNKTTYEHYFDSEVDTRRVKIYVPDTTTFTYLDTTNIGGAVLTLKPVVVDEFVCQSHGYTLSGLFLFEGTYRVDLKQCTISDLLPLGDLSLSELDLRYVKFIGETVVDDYLQYIVKNYGSRRACTVYLDEMPSAIGLAAIDKILGEEEWNEPLQWHFIIGGEEYVPSTETTE